MSNNLVIHMVVATSCEGDEYSFWHVCGYHDRDKAIEHAKLANDEAAVCYTKIYDSSDIDGCLMKTYDNVYISDETKYSVQTLFIHEEPSAFKYVEEKLLDYCIAQGWTP